MIRQATYTATATTVSAATKRLAIRSANRAKGGRCACACSTRRASCESRVFAPTSRTEIRAGRSRQTVPANTSSPACLRTGLDSPVNSASSKLACASSRTPSAGTASPAAMQAMSPISSAASGTASRLPSASSRVASAGRARANASTCALAMLRARCSSMRAASNRNTNITAASNHTCGPPRIVSTTLAP